MFVVIAAAVVVINVDVVAFTPSCSRVVPAAGVNVVVVVVVVVLFVIKVAVAAVVNAFASVVVIVVVVVVTVINVVVIAFTPSCSRVVFYCSC